jgi:hypothetical protein
MEKILEAIETHHKRIAGVVGAERVEAGQESSR